MSKEKVLALAVAQPIVLKLKSMECKSHKHLGGSLRGPSTFYNLFIFFRFYSCFNERLLIERSKSMTIKEFIKKNKKKLAITGGIIVTGAATYLLVKHGRSGGFEKLKEEVPKFFASKEIDLQIPEVGKNLGVTEYFQEEPFLRGMFVDTFAWHLGELGDLLVNELDANPDCPIAITLEYVSNE